MKGKYKTPDGSEVEVLDFDELNKIVMIKVDEGTNRWVDENEYSTWESLEGKTRLLEEAEVDTLTKSDEQISKMDSESSTVEEVSTIQEQDLAHQIEKDFEKEMLSDDKQNPIIDEPKSKRKRTPLKKKNK